MRSQTIAWSITRPSALQQASTNVPHVLPTERFSPGLTIAYLIIAHRHWDLDAFTVRAHILFVLPPRGVVMTLRGRSHAKPGSLLMDARASHTWAQCDDAVPGFV